VEVIAALARASVRCRRPGPGGAVHSQVSSTNWCEPSVNSARPPNRIVRFLSLSYAKQCERRFAGPVSSTCVHVARPNSQVSRAHCPSTPSPRSRPPNSTSRPRFWSNAVACSVRSEGPNVFDLRPLRAVEHPSVSKRLSATGSPPNSTVQLACRVESHRVSGSPRRARIARPASSTCRPTTTCPWGPRSPEEVGSAFEPSRRRARNSTAGMARCLVLGPQQTRTPGMMANIAGREGNPLTIA